MRKFFLLLGAVTFAALTLEGCAEHYFTISNPNPAGQFHKMDETVWAWQAVDVLEAEAPDPAHKITEISWAWGAIKKPRISKACDPLDSVDRVRIRDNIFYGVLSLATLGLARPLDIVYQCSADREENTRNEEPCDITDALSEVRIQQNFGNGVLSLVTLGFVRTLNIEFKCFAGRVLEGKMD